MYGTGKTLNPSPACKTQLQRVNNSRYNEIKKSYPQRIYKFILQKNPKPACFSNVMPSFPLWHSSLTRLIMKRYQGDSQFRVVFSSFLLCCFFPFMAVFLPLLCMEGMKYFRVMFSCEM